MTPEEKLLDRQRAYQLVFNTPAGASVLGDLDHFCFADDSTIVAPLHGPVDIYRTFAAQGRREARLRIRDFLELSSEELLKKYTRPAKGAHGHVNDDPPQPE